MAKTPKTSMRDVAAAAGVSVTTVSHVLNDVPGKRITADTRDRVRAVAQELGYRHNHLARGLRLGRSQTLALVSDVIATTPFAGQMVLGAQEAAAKVGWVLMLVNTSRDPALEAREIRSLLERQVDGFLYATMFHRIVEVPELLVDTPTVLLDARSASGSVSSVVPDEVSGGRTAVEELVRHGHRRIGFLTNVDDIPATAGRLEGYRQALAAAGIALDETLVAADTSDSYGGERAARRLLTRTDRPTGIFCFSDRMAMGAYHVAAELGLRIPQDLSVVGFDNQAFVADGLRPELTTLALPHYEMGVWAVEQLLQEMDLAAPVTPSHQSLPCPIVRRSSVGPPGPG
ncbi:LacI family DNA-binding transcriptional regulator [Terrabacter sp. MAHUQ-38]|uniref:LacI family DNA-binding transcriptional regulator n=1 Tax=unclassified Terrabacter TaxID=2630222 RepID=UPI00165D76DC|nr:LacI family DNA-binding transcriptional regulator [Terrabacter sp. MAHUQ-38]MBC9822612.1 LacI family DNA-binding transcriptional regulator [Terrabacter sp. MAHUQ-38]